MTSIGDLAKALGLTPDQLILDAGRFKGPADMMKRVALAAEGFKAQGPAHEVTSDDADILTAASCYWLPISPAT